MNKKKAASGDAHKNTPTPSCCNCYEFDGRRFVPGIPVQKLHKTRRIGLALCGDDPRGVPLSKDLRRRPKVVDGRVYEAGLTTRGELTNGREGSRHLLILTPACTSVYPVQLSSGHDRKISVIGPLEQDLWDFEGLSGASFDRRAIQLLLRLPYEGQDERPDIDASISPAVRLHLFSEDPPQSVVIGVDPSYVRSGQPCRPWVAGLNLYSEATRRAVRKLSKKFFKATEKIGREGLPKKRRAKVQISRRRKVRTATLDL